MQDLQHYIESGILEQYALGELTATEQDAVDDMAARHPEVRHELYQVQATLGMYAEAHAVAPPAGLRERVLAQVLGTPAPSARLRADVDALARPAAAPPVPLAASRSPWAAAASVGLVLSLLANGWLYSRWQQTHSDLVAVQADQARLASSTQVVEKRLATLREQNTVLRNDDFRAVALAGTPAVPTAHARVLFNPATRKVFVDVKSLPALPAGKQYQLWALDNGQPVDAGLLTAATAAGDGLQPMKDVARAQAFAVTVEPAGGSASPTLSTMAVLGKLI